MLRFPARLLATLVLMAGVGCSFIPAYTAPTEFRAADLVPADTWLFTEVTLRPSLSQLAAVSKLANVYTSQPGWDTYLQRMTDSVGGESSLTSDVLPLLDGEIAFAAFGAQNTTQRMPPFVVLAHSSNPDRLVGLLTSEVGTSATPPRRDQHGANVYALPEAGGLATLKNWLVVASTESVLNDTLDRINGTATSNALSGEAKFKALLARLPADRLGMEYTDNGALYRSIGSVGAATLPPDTQARLGSVDSQAAMSFAAGDAGIELRVESASHLPADLASATEVSDPGAAFEHLPADTLAAVGTGLPAMSPAIDDVLTSVLQEAAATFDVPELTQLELHPSQWLMGPVAFGGSAGTLGEQPDGSPDVFFVAQVSDRSAAQTDLDTFTSLFPPKAASPITVAGAKFMQVPATKDLSLTYGIADDWLYAVSGDAEAVVHAADSGGLSENPRFGALQSALGSDTANVFVDIVGARDLATGMLRPGQRQFYETEFRPLVAPLTFFGGGFRSDPNGDGHGHFVIGLGS